MSTVKAEMATRKEFDGFSNVNFNTLLPFQQEYFQVNMRFHTSFHEMFLILKMIFTIEDKC